MIDVKQAANVAISYLTELMPEIEPRSARLDEVELSEDREFWSITLSYPDPGAMYTPYPQIREYKMFKIASQTGEVLSMKIRKSP